MFNERVYILTLDSHQMPGNPSSVYHMYTTPSKGGKTNGTYAMARRPQAADYGFSSFNN